MERFSIFVTLMVAVVVWLIGALVSIAGTLLFVALIALLVVFGLDATGIAPDLGSDIGNWLGVR